MSMGKRGKTTNAERERIAIQAQAERESMIGEIPGRVVSFDPVKQTITVQPTYRPVHDGKPVDMPELQEVPVRFPRAGGFIMTTPVKSGDMVTLRPQMRSSEEYHTGGSHESPKDTRSMSLSGMEAFLDGGESLTNPIENFNSENFEIRSADGNFKFEMSEDGKFKIVGAEGNWYELVAQLAELLAADGLDVKFGSSLGTTHALQNRAEYTAIGAKLRAMVL